jgi:GT2 family glycosyltransferase
MNHKVAVIILNFNGIRDTVACLDSMSDQSYKDYDVIVVDNGSSDNSRTVLDRYKEKHSKVSEVLYNVANLGFAGGVNTGIRRALELKYEYVALFNNDATADKKWLESLVQSSIKQKASIVTGLLLRENKETIDSTGEIYSLWGIPFSHLRDQAVALSPKSGYVFGATGGASLYKTSLFKDIGLFDESFFAYYEDVDISFRAQLAGHKVYFTDKAIAYHKQGATSKKIPGLTVYQTFKNIPLLFTKNVPAGLLLPIGIRLLLLYVLIFGNAVKNGSGKYALKGWLASIWYFWTRAIWQRIRIQARRKVSTNYIKSIIWHDIPPNQTGMRKFRQFFTGKP